jgi:hypothetical protein
MHNANLGTQVFQEKTVAAGGHGPWNLTRKVKVGQGVLALGLILALDLAGELIPYQAGSKALGAGNGTNKDFSGTFDLKNLAPGSVTVSDGGTSPQTLADDGHGRLYGAGSGTVNYLTGAVSVSFTAAPANGDAVTAAAYNQPIGVNVHLVDTAQESAAVILAHGTVRRDALLVGASPAVAADMVRLEAIGIYPV